MAGHDKSIKNQHTTWLKELKRAVGNEYINGYFRNDKLKESIIQALAFSQSLDVFKNNLTYKKYIDDMIQSIKEKKFQSFLDKDKDKIEFYFMINLLIEVNEKEEKKEEEFFTPSIEAGPNKLNGEEKTKDTVDEKLSQNDIDESTQKKSKVSLNSLYGEDDEDDEDKKVEIELLDSSLSLSQSSNNASNSTTGKNTNDQAGEKAKSWNIRNSAKIAMLGLALVVVGGATFNPILAGIGVGLIMCGGAMEVSRYFGKKEIEGGKGGGSKNIYIFSSSSPKEKRNQTNKNYSIWNNFFSKKGSTDKAGKERKSSIDGDKNSINKDDGPSFF